MANAGPDRRNDDPRPRRRKRLLALLLLLLLLGTTATIVTLGVRGPPETAAAGGPGSHAEADPALPATGPRPRAKRPAAAAGGSKAPAAQATPSSPRPHMQVFGAEVSTPQRYFGNAVAIDGDVAVVAAPGEVIGEVRCGAAYVYVRDERGWRMAQRLDPPRPDARGFAQRVGVAGETVIVFGGTARSVDSQAFHVFDRGADGKWSETEEVPTGDEGGDAVFRGATAAVVRSGVVQVFERRNQQFGEVQRIWPPSDGHRRVRFGAWLALDGDVLLVNSSVTDATTGAGRTDVYRRAGGRFALEATLDLGLPSERGALALDGSLFVRPGAASVLLGCDRGGGAWSSLWSLPYVDDSYGWFRSARIAADGPTVVAAARAAFVVFTFRHADAWRTVRVNGPSTARLEADEPFGADPIVALSGRSALVGRPWDDRESGSVWFVEMSEADAARASPVDVRPLPAR